MQPAFQHSAAHRGDGAVEHRGEGVFDTTGQVLGDLQITAGGCIHNDAVLLALNSNGTDMRQGGALGIFHILQQTASSAQAARGIFYPKAGEIAGAKLQIELLARGIYFKFPQWTTTQAATAFEQPHLGKIFGVQ